MTADESPLSRAVQGVTLSCAALPGLRRFAAGEGDKPKRAQLRGWLKALLADYDRRGRELAELREAAGKAPIEMTAVYEAAESERNHLARDNAELRARLRQAQCERDAWRSTSQGDVKRIDDLRAELVRLRDTAEHRPDYILLRLAGGQPEVLTVSVWDETDPTPAGGITATVEGYRAGTVTGRAECRHGSGDK